MVTVTKESMIAMLADPVKRQHVIGRALVAIFKRQTDSERRANVTSEHNSVGFGGSDAHSGSLTAKYYMKNKCLLSWQVDRWMALSRGAPRIAKYWRQLDEIAKAREDAHIKQGEQQ